MLLRNWSRTRLTAASLLGVCSLALATQSIPAAALPVETAVFSSRELVDVEFQTDRSLAILISTPGASVPGLFRWGHDQAQPKKLCDIYAPSFFSFDRRVVIERERGATSRIRLYAPHDCRMLADVEIIGRVLDVDVRGSYLAAAVRLADKQIALQLFHTDGRIISTTSIGRNVEMGFSPDGAMLVNFDLSDVGLQAWRVPKLTNILLPHWLHDGDVTFVPGSRFVKRYEDGSLIVTRWPIGNALYTLPASRALRLRQLSADGRFGVAHEFLNGVEELQWIDFKQRTRTVLAKGTIDNAALSADLTQAAWSLRQGGSEHRVWVQRRMAPARASEGASGQTPDDTPAQPPDAPPARRAEIEPLTIIPKIDVVIEPIKPSLIVE
jgi:hypothetical protein